MDIYNLTYDKLQKKIVWERRKKFLDDLTSYFYQREGDRGGHQEKSRNYCHNQLGLRMSLQVKHIIFYG